LGSTNQGTVGPAGNYSSTTITLTANGGNFTAGAVRLALMYLYLQPPTS
jgi:formate/nitrite transporter FocA (FNT family)